MSTNDDLQVLRANIALLTRWRGTNHPETLAAREEYAKAKLRVRIAAAMAEAPPLTDADIDELIKLFSVARQ